MLYGLLTKDILCNFNIRIQLIVVLLKVLTEAYIVCICVGCIKCRIDVMRKIFSLNHALYHLSNSFVYSTVTGSTQSWMPFVPGSLAYRLSRVIRVILRPFVRTGLFVSLSDTP